MANNSEEIILTKEYKNGIQGGPGEEEKVDRLIGINVTGLILAQKNVRTKTFLY